MGRKDTVNVVSDDSQKSSDEDGAEGEAYVVERIVGRRVKKGKVSRRFNLIDIFVGCQLKLRI